MVFRPIAATPPGSWVFSNIIRRCRFAQPLGFWLTTLRVAETVIDISDSVGFVYNDESSAWEHGIGSSGFLSRFLKAELPKLSSQRGCWEPVVKQTSLIMPTLAAICPFCSLPASRIISEDSLSLVIRDAYPVSPGHSLIIPKRHVASWFELTDDERTSLFQNLSKAKTALDTVFKPDGYNIGINEGAAAGQTVFHLHVHLIPRYHGDRADPRGGVCGGFFPKRQVIGFSLIIYSIFY